MRENVGILRTIEEQVENYVEADRNIFFISTNKNVNHTNKTKHRSPDLEDNRRTSRELRGS
jgi:hypothetical protein